jgi:hypothetical protein
MTEITDHVAQAHAKLISLYQDKPLFLAWLDTYVKQVQEFEDAVWQVIRSRFLDEADDVRAEMLGKLVGQPRRGEDLATYKLYISVRILVNRSLARAKDILQIAEILLLDQTAQFEEGGASFVLRTREPLNALTDPEVIVEMIKAAKGAGIGFLFIYPTVPSGGIFRYTSESPTADPTEGWGSTTETTGGKWSTVIDGRVTGYIT